MIIFIYSIYILYIENLFISITIQLILGWWHPCWDGGIAGLDSWDKAPKKVQRK